MNTESEMLPTNTLEMDVGSSSPAREYGTTGKNFLLELMPGESRTETASCLLETVAVGRCYGEEGNETSRIFYPESECTKRKIESAGSSTRSVNDRPRQSFSKSSASLQSLVRRKSRKHGGSSLPLDVDISSYSSHPSCVLDPPKENCVNSVYRNDEEPNACMTTRTSTLIYASSAQLSSRGENNAQDISSSTNNVATTVTTANSASNVTSSMNGSRYPNTATSLIRTTSVVTAGPSTSSWNNSTEEELDYVVDPVQGNAYYKGQLLGKVRYVS